MDMHQGEQRSTETGIRVLVVEDDRPLANFLQKHLQTEEYSVDLAEDGELGCEAITHGRYDLLILDLNLPKLDGLAVLERVRPLKPNLPVLVLTARSGVEDRVLSLDHGADDCLVKPFSFTELSARLRALLRRHKDLTKRPIRVGDLVLDRKNWRVERAGRRLDLTSKEFAVLEYLMRNTGAAVTREMLMENVWNSPYDASSNLADVYIKYVRDKVDGIFEHKLIRTIRGVGYVLSDD